MGGIHPLVGSGDYLPDARTSFKNPARGSPLGARLRRVITVSGEFGAS